MAYNSKYTGAEVENLLGKIDNKQDTISDLDEIRSGASKGATAVQPGDIPNSAEPMVCVHIESPLILQTILSWITTPIMVKRWIIVKVRLY